jgi:LPXTG-motif cell wall-anchored protein
MTRKLPRYFVLIMVFMLVWLSFIMVSAPVRGAESHGAANIDITGITNDLSGVALPLTGNVFDVVSLIGMLLTGTGLLVGMKLRRNSFSGYL